MLVFSEPQRRGSLCIVTAPELLEWMVFRVATQGDSWGGGGATAVQALTDSAIILLAGSLSL